MIFTVLIPRHQTSARQRVFLILNFSFLLSQRVQRAFPFSSEKLSARLGSVHWVALETRIASNVTEVLEA
jgi:hypothetical protein